MGWRQRFRRAPVTGGAVQSSPLPPMAERLLAGMREAWVLLDASGAIIETRGIEGLGILRDGALDDVDLVRQVARTRAGEGPESCDVAIGGAEVGAPPRTVRATTAIVDDDLLLLLLEDISAEARVDAMRREFISTVAQELRDPVDEMLRAAKGMERALRKGKPLVELTAQVESGARRLGALVSDITDISRLQSVDSMEAAREVSVTDLVAGAIDAVQVMARDHHVTLEAEVPELRFVANAEQISMALRNLLTNAITYSDPNTRVWVRASAQGEHVVLTVEDEGIGIPSEHLDRIFDRFHRVDPERSRATGGTGLGLAIVRQICEAHGGDVSVASTEGRGSVFTMRLPSRRLDAASSAQVWQEGL